MATCDFCGHNIEKGTGKVYVKDDGRIINFCSNKCEKNLLFLNRKPRTTKWTEEFKTVKVGSKKSGSNK